MYKIAYEGDEILIRFERDLADSEMLSQFLSHLNCQSISAKNDLSEAAKMRLKDCLIHLPTGAALLRDPILTERVPRGRTGNTEA